MFQDLEDHASFKFEGNRRRRRRKQNHMSPPPRRGDIVPAKKLHCLYTIVKKCIIFMLIKKILNLNTSERNVDIAR